MQKRFQFRRGLRAGLLLVLLAGHVHAELPADYESVFNELTALVDGSGITPGKMIQGSWLSVRYFSSAKDGLDVNRQHFLSADSLGKMALSGLFLAVHGGFKEHLLVCRELESSQPKRRWLWLNFGSEARFFQRLVEGQRFQPLTQTLPPTDGLKKQIRILMNSKDSLTRRTGLFMGSWVADDGYRWKVGQMAASDADPVNRACAARLLKQIR